MNTVNHVICVQTSEGDHQGQAGVLGSRELEKLPFSLLSQLPCGSCSIDPVRETLFGSLILGFLSFAVIVDEKEKNTSFLHAAHKESPLLTLTFPFVQRNCKYPLSLGHWTTHFRYKCINCMQCCNCSQACDSASVYMETEGC